MLARPISAKPEACVKRQTVQGSKFKVQGEKQEKKNTPLGFSNRTWRVFKPPTAIDRGCLEPNFGR
jgi:hypothetical protein